MSRFPHMFPTIISLASNVRGGPNPPYTLADFAEAYPQFFEPPTEPEAPDPDSAESYIVDSFEENIIELKPVIPMVMMETLLKLAHASIKHLRFRSAWKFCMGLFIAHFVTLYLETMIDPGADPATLAKAGQAGGLMSSKSVDSVSVNYDFSTVASDLDGWAEWKATTYGLQLATFAKMFSMGGMYIR